MNLRHLSPSRPQLVVGTIVLIYLAITLLFMRYGVYFRRTGVGNNVVEPANFLFVASAIGLLAIWGAMSPGRTLDRIGISAALLIALLSIAVYPLGTANIAAYVQMGGFFCWVMISIVLYYFSRYFRLVLTCGPTKLQTLPDQQISLGDMVKWTTIIALLFGVTKFFTPRLAIFDSSFDWREAFLMTMATLVVMGLPTIVIIHLAVIYCLTEERPGHNLLKYLALSLIPTIAGPLFFMVFLSMNGGYTRWLGYVAILVVFIVVIYSPVLLIGGTLFALRLGGFRIQRIPRSTTTANHPLQLPAEMQ